MNFFLLYVSLPALLFGIMSKTPLRGTQQSAIPDCDHDSATMPAFFLSIALLMARWIGEACHFGKPHWQVCAGGYGNVGYMGPGLALAVLGPKAAAPTALDLLL